MIRRTKAPEPSDREWRAGQAPFFYFGGPGWRVHGLDIETNAGTLFEIDNPVELRGFIRHNPEPDAQWKRVSGSFVINPRYPATPPGICAYCGHPVLKR
jgi:hypothetical protein